MYYFSNSLAAGVFQRSNHPIYGPMQSREFGENVIQPVALLATQSRLVEVPQQAPQCDAGIQRDRFGFGLGPERRRHPKKKVQV